MFPWETVGTRSKSNKKIALQVYILTAAEESNAQKQNNRKRGADACRQLCAQAGGRVKQSRPGFGRRRFIAAVQAPARV
jgi:hypothetical protein